MSRFDNLIETVEAYQALAAENYDRIRTLAEEVRSGFCDYLGASDGVCVHLVPPAGAYKPKAHGDAAFSIPPRGFRLLGPISFGLAVRVSRDTDWLRLVMQCRKTGEKFKIQIEDGSVYEFSLPLKEAAPDPFYEHLYQHILLWFSDRVERYKEGDYGTREIGFDFADDINAAQA